MPSNILDKAP